MYIYIHLYTQRKGHVRPMTLSEEYDQLSSLEVKREKDYNYADKVKNSITTGLRGKSVNKNKNHILQNTLESQNK